MYPRCAQKQAPARTAHPLEKPNHFSLEAVAPAGEQLLPEATLKLPVAPRCSGPSIAKADSSQLIEAKTASVVEDRFPESSEGCPYLPSRSPPQVLRATRQSSQRSPNARLANLLVSQTNKSLYISAASPANISQHFARTDIDSVASAETDAKALPLHENDLSRSSSDNSSTSPARRIDDAAVSCLMTQYFNERGVAGTLRGDSELLWADDSSSRNNLKNTTSLARLSENSTRCDMPFMGSPNDPLLSGSSDVSSGKHWLDADHFPGMAAVEDFGHLSKDLTNSQAAVINLLKSRSPTSHDSSGRPPVRGRRTTAIFGQP